MVEAADSQRRRNNFYKTQTVLWNSELNSLLWNFLQQTSIFHVKIYCNSQHPFLDKISFIKSIRIGEESFEHANVLSEKSNCSALVGPEVAIFGRDDLDPLCFDVSNFSVPPDPPICLKMPKCTMLTTFWESHLKHTHKVGVRREKFNIGNVAQFFRAFFNVGTMSFRFRNIYQ